ncbi:hepatitis A virus cellular receptor 1-like [Clarias gariepinus]|uniref:hepatitis A virus cellular receptor 1-like n=1 Tax=Clarias gariepinus TaxID=13013 RepID=UPI00234E27BB|nr:hepatitis A virus cellular receptor 1-like [Clarias gariepinus]
MFPLILLVGAIILTDASTVFPTTTTTSTVPTTSTATTTTTTTTSPGSSPSPVNTTSPITQPQRYPVVIGLRAKIVSTVQLDINLANSILQQYVSYLQPSQAITARVTSIKML